MPLTVTATVGPEGTTVLVGAPGCQPTPPGEFEIFVQLVSPTGEIGEGAVGAGTFTAPGQGSVLIPAGTPGSSFLLTASCNGDTLTGSLPFVLAAPMPSPPIVAAGAVHRLIALARATRAVRSPARATHGWRRDWDLNPG